MAIYPGGMRLVSLLPSATEIVYALGLGEDLVGVTFECDEPPAARVDKTVVVGGLDTRGMSPGEIDRYVRRQLAAGSDLYTPRSTTSAAGPMCCRSIRTPATTYWIPSRPSASGPASRAGRHAWSPGCATG